MEFVSGQMVVNMRAPGKTTHKTVTAYFHSRKEIFIKVKSKMVGHMEKVNLPKL